MFGNAIESEVQLSAPEVEAMARQKGPLRQGDALAYVRSLPEGERAATSGCYIIHLVRPCKCPVACAYNLECGGCLWPGISTIPFGCCIILNRMGEPYYINAKGDTLVMKVDSKKQTLACFVNGCGTGPCCFCDKL